MPGGTVASDRFPRSVGLLGSGPLSAAVLRRLLTGLPSWVAVAAYARDAQELDVLREIGAAAAASPADLAARCEVIVVLLEDLAEIQEHLDGASGVHAGTHSRTTLVIGAVLSPGDVRRLGGTLTQRTAGMLRLVDAPLAGSRAEVAAGRLAIGVGSAPELYDEVRPLLSLLGTVVRVGPLGGGQVAHACRDLIAATNAWALAELVLIGERAGVDPRRMFEVLAASTAHSELLDDLGQRLIRRDFDPDVPVDQLRRSLAVAAAGTGRPANPARLPHRLMAFLDDLVAEGQGQRDASVLYEHLARQRRPASSEPSPAPPVES